MCPPTRRVFSCAVRRLSPARETTRRTAPAARPRRREATRPGDTSHAPARTAGADFAVIGGAAAKRGQFCPRISRTCEMNSHFGRLLTVFGALWFRRGRAPARTAAPPLLHPYGAGTLRPRDRRPPRHLHISTTLSSAHLRSLIGRRRAVRRDIAGAADASNDTRTRSVMRGGGAATSGRRFSSCRSRSARSAVHWDVAASGRISGGPPWFRFAPIRLSRFHLQRRWQPHGCVAG
jgi:hypothetical protein